jgi:(3S)-malyl-CoA thioesterase
MRRLLRSALFCPGNNIKVLNKSASLRPDAFIFDLEDAVTSGSKAAARDTLNNFLSVREPNPCESASRATLAVRVNCPLSTEWGADDIAVFSRQPGVDTVVLPKVESVESINRALTIIKENRDPEHKAINIWAMIETAKGVLKSELVCEHNSVEAIVFGSNDLTRDLRAVHTPDRAALQFSMSMCILAARANRKFVIDGVFNDFRDDFNFVQTCIMGNNMGFDGRSLIHPCQIDPANASYSPSESEIQCATELVAAWKQAVSEGKSLAVVNGKLVEELHFLEAQELLGRANYIQGAE